MTTPTRDGHSQGLIDRHLSFGKSGPELENYFLQSAQQLAAMTELANRGEAIGRDSREWLLAQVDFIVEIIGNESLKLDEALRSNLLQLLLTIANLNEQIRHQTSLGL